MVSIHKKQEDTNKITPEKDRVLKWIVSGAPIEKVTWHAIIITSYIRQG